MEYGPYAEGYDTQEHQPRLGKASAATLLILPLPMAALFGITSGVSSFFVIWMLSFIIALAYVTVALLIYELINKWTRPKLQHALFTGLLFGATNAYIPFLNLASAFGIGIAILYGLVGSMLFWFVANGAHTPKKKGPENSDPLFLE